MTTTARTICPGCSHFSGYKEREIINYVEPDCCAGYPHSVEGGGGMAVLNGLMGARASVRPRIKICHNCGTEATSC